MSQTEKRRVNRKAVLVLSAATVALGVTVHLVHGYQIKRNAPALLEQASQQEQEGQLAEAADTLSQYLGMVPSDTDALARYGLLLGRQAKTGKARMKVFFVLEQVLRRDGERRDVRRRVAELATEVGRFSDARHHLEALVSAEGESAELLRLLAHCDVGTKEFDKATERLARAAELAPANVEVCEEHALLLRTRLKEPEAGDTVMEDLVKRNERLLAARLAAARYFFRFAPPDKAAKHVQFTLKELAPDDADALLLAAEIARAQRQAAEARGYLERGLRAHPGDARLSQALARLEVQDGHLERALQHLQGQKQSLPADEVRTGFAWKTAP